MSTSSRTSKLRKVLSRYHFVLALFFVLILVTLEGLFLYKNFFRTLQETKTLIELKQQAVLEPLKLNLFEKALRVLEDKKNGNQLNLNSLRDPFSPKSTVTAP